MERKCLNEIEVAILVDYLLGVEVKPDNRILGHVEGGFGGLRDVVRCLVS